MKKKETKEEKETKAVKEHKPNWRELRATEQDIQEFLAKNIVLRYNEVTGKVEGKVYGADVFAEMKYGYFAGKVPLYEWRNDDTWHVMTDRMVNSLCNMMTREKEVTPNKIWQVLNSDFVQPYNPFRRYLDSLPPWDEETNPILVLSMTVSVKGSEEEQMLFYLCLTKWLVAMVAGWLDEQVVNQEILVLVGRQGIYKTTWFNHLLPDELRPYFHSNTSFGNMNKDEVLKLSQYGLICCEELDTMKPAEMNRLKWAVTTLVTDERAPYAHTAERRKHIASYCGTGNHIQFIDDDTGTRRWLPFEVDHILPPMDSPVTPDEVFAQAYRLYQKGYKYWFSEMEMDMIRQHNKRFEVAKPELELISKYFYVPGEGEQGEFVSSTEILQTVGGLLTSHLTLNKLGRAMTTLGFESMRSRGRRGYNVMRYNAGDMETNRSFMANEAKPEWEDLRLNSGLLSGIVDSNDRIK